MNKKTSLMQKCRNENVLDGTNDKGLQELLKQMNDDNIPFEATVVNESLLELLKRG